MGLLEDKYLKDDEFKKLYKQEGLILEVTENICDYMKQHGISRAELARRLNVTKGYVSKVLNDENSNLTLRTLADFAQALGVEVGFHIVEAEAQPVSSAMPKTLTARKMDDIGSWKASVEHRACGLGAVRSKKPKKGRKLPLAFNE